jgi:hypothetical protein
MASDLVKRWPDSPPLCSPWRRQMAKKETIKPPTKNELKDASKELHKGHPSGGRTMVDKSVAVRQGVSKKGK